MEAPICQGCVERDARIADLERRVAQLEALVRQLMGKVPPPLCGTTRGKADLPKPEAKKPSGKKAGGQPGHPPHLKKLLPIERVTQVVPYLPTHCECCQAKLSAEAGPKDPEPTRHQVAELPVIRAEVVEHQGHYRTCPNCQHVTHADSGRRACRERGAEVGGDHVVYGRRTSRRQAWRGRDRGRRI